MRCDDVLDLFAKEASVVGERKGVEVFAAAEGLYSRSVIAPSSRRSSSAQRSCSLAAQRSRR